MCLLEAPMYSAEFGTAWCRSIFARVCTFQVLVPNFMFACLPLVMTAWS